MNRKKFFKKDLIIITIIILTFATSKTFGDGGFISQYYSVGKIFQGNQMAVIKYDNGIEDVIFKVKYDGKVDEFGWIIPVPAQPKVDTKSEDFDNIFKELDVLTRPLSSGKVGWGSRGALGSEGYWADAYVYVVEESTVGIYEIAIIQAYNSTALNNWLSMNRYIIPTGGENVINEYINKNWYFVIAKIIPEQLEEKGNIHPIRLTFNSPSIVYPMKITSMSAGENMDVLLYVFTDNWVSILKDGKSEIITVSYKEILEKDISWSCPVTCKFLNKDRYFLTKIGLRYYSPSDMNEDIVLKKTTTVPQRYIILENYPNPFNATTYIEYNIPLDSFVEIKVYNVLGQEIETLVSLWQRAGRYTTIFNGRNLPSGIYICRLKTKDFIKAMKITLLK